MLDRYLVEHCAPTLASLKTANLFRISFPSLRELKENLSLWNKLLNPKGVSVTVLQIKQSAALVYVYRPSRLNRDLHEKEVPLFLSHYGYHYVHPEDALSRLRDRLEEADGFPHEIGLFLGYPLGDVKGFIQNEGKNCKCSGCWKVYCNQCEAERLFAKFKKCRLVYSRLFLEGRSVIQLTVAA